MGNTHIKAYPKNVQNIIFYKEYNLNNKPLVNFPDSVISLSILRDCWVKMYKMYKLNTLLTYNFFIILINSFIW